MALADDKRNVFTTIGSYTSFMEQVKPVKRTDIFPSINNKKDVVPFLLDTLKTVAGTDSLKELIGGMVTKLVASGETAVKTVLKKQFIQSNSGEGLPNDFIINGINLKVKDIDITGKLKLSPTGETGSLLYRKAVDVDKLLHSAIVNAGASISFGDLNVSCVYDDVADSFNIKPSGVPANIGEFFINYIDKTEILNSDELVSNIMDGIYGVISKKTKKTQEQLFFELQVQKLLEQVMNDNDSFLILPRDYDVLLNRATELVNGEVNYDMGCGLMSASLPFNSLDNLITTITGSVDAFAVGNAIENTIVESTSGDTATQTATTENKQTVKDGFFQKLIQIFANQMIFSSTMQPQIRMLLAIMGSFQNKGEVLIGNALEDMKQFKIFIKCMIKDILNMISEYIFNLAIAYLISLLTPVIKKIVKEKINQYIATIKSLSAANKVSQVAKAVGLT